VLWCSAKVTPSCPKPNRPQRPGARREAVESGLAAAAAKLGDVSVCYSIYLYIYIKVYSQTSHYLLWTRMVYQRDHAILRSMCEVNSPVTFCDEKFQIIRLMVKLDDNERL
jgi:hypothetical protein